ncbi:MAG: VIT1/CCC1 transporter family protein [Lewinellaceae bacterium]|nr:VIT1/CCC1 transporter family protein [Lewinellaceae bacterium]
MKKLKSQLQEEIDAGFLYGKLAEAQEEPTMAQVLAQLGKIEEGHARKLTARFREKEPSFTPPGPSLRARTQWRLSKVFGTGFIMSNLSSMERGMARAAIIQKEKEGEPISGTEHTHLRIIEAVAQQPSTSVSGGLLARFEGRHKSVGGNALRAAVLGANDGLVSNMSLVMGVAGATEAQNAILITGLAGLLAGAISMALGEWLSVQSSRELYLRQIAMEAEELEASPEEEKRELILLYQAKGMDADEAERLAGKVMSDKEIALDTLVREELGIDKEELGGSAWEAAFASFFLFAVGAIIPVLPYLFMQGGPVMYVSLAFSVVGLFAIGAAITLFTGRSIWSSGARQVFFGLAAAAVTYGIGKLIGVSLAG